MPESFLPPPPCVITTQPLDFTEFRRCMGLFTSFAGLYSQMRQVPWKANISMTQGTA
jgi:hypothetical protein